MEAILLSRSRKSFIFLPIIVSAFCFYSAFADEGPAQTLTNALLCFNNKFIYNRCSEAYRLNQSGDLSVPPEATDEFCNGACLSETQGMLSCIDDIVSGFLFYNKATTRDITGTLHSACSYTKQRGKILCVLNGLHPFSTFFLCPSFTHTFLPHDHSDRL
ncbi:uncharacterized protein LOC131307459 [Rhododendron vialii]|uniref:uncharacterized protein LOC131307459 n=1 Tax=Rhododendron vialii TaxID=182163 RepID=UPI00265EA7E4|nr:uncharacterized protein LOC131307459 [Rhododendron vialii]